MTSLQNFRHFQKRTAYKRVTRRFRFLTSQTLPFLFGVVLTVNFGGMSGYPSHLLTLVITK